MGLKASSRRAGLGAGPPGRLEALFHQWVNHMQSSGNPVRPKEEVFFAGVSLSVLPHVECVCVCVCFGGGSDFSFLSKHFHSAEGFDGVRRNEARQASGEPGERQVRLGAATNDQSWFRRRKQSMNVADAQD